jgi:hypothetical protein
MKYSGGVSGGVEETEKGKVESEDQATDEREA